MTSSREIGSRIRAEITLVLAPLLVIACGSGAILPGSATPETGAVPSLSQPAGSVATPVPSRRDATPTPTVTPTEPYEGVPVTRIAAEILDLDGAEVGYMAASAHHIWVATTSGLVRIDPKTSKPKFVDHEGRFGVAASARSVWTTDFDAETVSRFDASTARRTTSAELVGSPNAVAVLGDSVWVAQHRRGSITRLVEPSARVLALIDVGPAGRSGPQGVTATADGVWVGVPNIGSVVRIDASSNAIVATIETPASPCGGITVLPDAVWVSTCFDDHFALRIDPRTNRNVAQVDIGGPNGGAVMVSGYPWFPVGGRLVRVNPATNSVDRVLEFADRFSAFGSTIGFGSVWIGGTEGEVARVPLSAVGG